MSMRKYSRSRRYLYVVPCTAVAWTLWTILVSFMKEDDNPVYLHKSRAPLAEEDDVIQCIPSGIDAFPPDFLSQEQRRQGGVIVHVIIVSYVCAMLAIVCDEYFVPALEAIAERLKLSPMWPEQPSWRWEPPHPSYSRRLQKFRDSGAVHSHKLYNVRTYHFSSFVTEDDIGLGTILGSAVFNILGISGIVGIVLWNQPLSIQRYPVIRDCIVYGLTVLMLSFIIVDNIVFWWEALTLVLIFCSYIILMKFNAKIESAVQDLVRYCRRQKRASSEKDPLLKKNMEVSPAISSEKECEKLPESTESHTVVIDSEEEEDEGIQCCCMPAWRVVMWLPSLLFRLTIPPVKWYPATFIVSIAWMGGLSYIAVWMVTIIGYTLSIPDSVSGLTLLAAGSSVPDLIATVVIARSGKGNMAISNLLGSNTFDLAFCLGTPWLIKTLTSGGGRLLVYSSAMVYTVATLMGTLIALLVTFQLNGWKLNKVSGVVCLSLYVVCITFACLYELNVFGEINKPVCS